MNPFSKNRCMLEFPSLLYTITKTINTIQKPNKVTFGMATMSKYNLRLREPKLTALWEAAEALPKSYEVFDCFMLDACKRNDCTLDHKRSRKLAICANKLRGLRFDRHRYPTNYRNYWRYRKQFESREPDFNKIPFDPQAMIEAFHAAKNELAFDEPHYIDVFCPLHIMMQATAEMLWTLEKRLQRNKQVLRAFQRKFRSGVHNYKRKCMCRHLGYYSYTRQDILDILRLKKDNQTKTKDGQEDEIPKEGASIVDTTAPAFTTASPTSIS